MKILELRENVKNSNGITLVTLVISIIVLLILATVTIQTLTGNNGLLTKAETAVQSNKDSQELEKIKLAVSSAQLAGQGSITTDNLNGELRANFSDNSINVDEKSGGWFFKKNKEYTIFDDGKIQEGNLLLLPKEYQQVEYLESSGIQWINTKLDYNNCHFFDIKILMKSFRGTKDTHWGGIFINRFDWNANKSFGIQAYLKDNGEEFIVVKDGELLAEYQANKNVIYTLKYDNDGLYINNDKICNRGIGLQNLPGYFPLFGLIDRSVNASKILDGEAMIGQIYYAKFYNNNGIALKKFIPCYSTVTVTNADGVQVPANTKGMYDLVEGKFYTNQGTGEFIAGPDV